MYWFSQLVLAMRDIHKLNIMHKDIKTHNVFLGKVNRPLIGDFGVSAHEDPNSKEKSCHPIGTIHYMAPEVCMS
jgi:serine/threonine protein kinase